MASKVGGRYLCTPCQSCVHGLENKMVAVDMSEVAECQAESIAKGECPCETPEIFDLTCLLMEEH